MARLSLEATEIKGLLAVIRPRTEDARGFFSPFYCSGELAAAGFISPIAQINQTFTQRRGAVRGMHYQKPPHSEDKFVSCLRGEIFDVAIDLRRGSDTFLRWHSEVLSSKNGRSLMIPKGFAHGFQTLTEDCELIYLHTAPYAAIAESALNAIDPTLAITWPLQISERSERDTNHPFLTADFRGF